MEEEPVAHSSKDTKKRSGPKRTGKASAQKRQDDYRKMKNAEVDSKYMSTISERLGILDERGPSSLEMVVKSKAKEISKVAIPLSVTTRGVGFATALTFDRLVTSFEGKPPEVPLTIHQMYRVHLWSFHYKMHLASTIATEVPSFPMPTTVIEPALTHVLEHIKVLPSAMSAILDCVGKVETATATYVACYVDSCSDTESAVDLAQRRALTITPDNIRSLLDLATHGTPEQRRRLRELWSIPGARFSDAGVLENGDEVYPPDYGHNQLLLDVQTYMAFSIRIRKRFPQHLIRDVVWSGNATSGMLWSTPVLEVGLESHFQILAASVTSRRRKRMDGSYYEAEVQEVRMARYLRTTVPSSGLSRFTSYQPTSDILSVVGCTSMVGEETGLLTRDYIGHPAYTDATPLSTMRAMLYAP